jgi:pimeloyl-[acyl-carrier protein] methyl ester esterase
VRLNGAAPVRDLVLLHGWGTHAGVWQPLAGELAPHFRVHAVDLPGYGAAPPCEPCTAAGMARALAPRLPARCLVCGWSLGGQVALAWAAAAPSQVERIALIATTPCFVRRADWPHALDAAVLRQFADALAADYHGTLRRFVSLQARGDERAKPVLQSLRAAVLARPAPAAGALECGLRALLDGDLRPLLPAVAQPALVLHGERDTLAPLAAAEHLAARLPRARLAVLRGAAHAPFVSDPAGVGARLRGFFDE